MCRSGKIQNNVLCAENFLCAQPFVTCPIIMCGQGHFNKQGKWAAAQSPLILGALGWQHFFFKIFFYIFVLAFIYLFLNKYLALVCVCAGSLPWPIHLHFAPPPNRVKWKRPEEKRSLTCRLSQSAEREPEEEPSVGVERWRVTRRCLAEGSGGYLYMELLFATLLWVLG